MKTQITKDDKLRTYIVIGMHRSGTSFITHCLMDKGAKMGEVMIPPSPGNPQGGCEDKAWDKLVNDIIEAAGGNWGRASLIEEDMGDDKVAELRLQFQDRIRKLIKKQANGWWGFKNPKATRVLEVILPFILEIDDDPYLIITVRKRSKIVADIVDHETGEQWYDRDHLEKVVAQFHDRLVKMIRTFQDL